MRAVNGIGVATNSGRSLQRPPIAVPNTCEDRHAHERGGDVRPVVDVVSQRKAAIPVLPTHHSLRVHFEQRARRAAILLGFGIENVSLPKAEIETLESIGMLMQQEFEISGRLWLVVIESSI